MSVSPADLVARCQAGDLIAQRALYDQFAPRVYRLAVRMVGAEDAADVAQQTFLKMFRGLASFRRGAQLSTWLYRIAVNESLQHRRRKRSPRIELPAELPDDAPDPGQRIEQAELIEQALASLDAELRAVFLLRELEGLSYQQIAEVLEIPAGTVASQLSRARSELRQHLTKVMSE